MNLDNGLTLAAILAAAALLIRAFANLLNSQSKRADTDTALIASLVSRTDTLSGTLQTVLLAQVAGRDREVAAATLIGDLKAKINELNALVQSKDIALLEALKPIAAGVILANQQLTEDQRKHSQASSDTQAQTDAAHTANVLKDYNSTQGIVDRVLPGTPSRQEVPPDAPVPQEVPPLDPPPMPVLVVDSMTGEAVKRLVS